MRAVQVAVEDSSSDEALSAIVLRRQEVVEVLMGVLVVLSGEGDKL